MVKSYQVISDEDCHFTYCFTAVRLSYAADDHARRPGDCLRGVETDPTEAGHLRQQAQEIVQAIANNISNSELRASFLGLAEVREVLSGAVH